MTKDFTKRSAEEARTHELLETVYRNEAKWSPERVMAANVFKAMWSSALPVDKIERVASAMYGMEADLKSTLTDLCREKVLRSRMDHGVRLYEINF